MPRRIFLSQRSPYARKVLILLMEKGLAFEPLPVDLTARSPEFVSISPLNKVPVLVDEDGTTVFDSTVIAEYLEDRYPETPMLGRGWAERMLQREFDELGDTLADQAVAIWQENLRGDTAGADRALAVARRALGVLGQRAREGRWPHTFGLGDAAVISGLGYFALRHGTALLDEQPEVLARAARHAMRPSVAATAPQA